MRTPKLLSNLNQVFLLLLSHSPKRMVDSDPNSRGLGSSNYNVLQDIPKNGDDNGKLETQSPFPRLVTPDGKCSTCLAENVHGEMVCCLLCEKNFHALCFELKDSRKVYNCDNACSPTLLKNINQLTASKKKSVRFGNFVFVCDSCLTNREQNKAAEVTTHVHLLQQKMSSMESDIAVIKDLLKSSTTHANKPNPYQLSVPQPDDKRDNPWNDTVRVEKLRHPATVVIQGDSGETVPLTDLENIITSNSIEANNTFKNKDGHTVVTLASQANRTKLVSALKHDYPHSDLRQPKVKLPTISISGIKGEITADLLKGQIMKLYPEIQSLVESGETFTVLSVRKQRNYSDENKLHQATIRVSNCIRKFIENRDDYLSIGLYRCKIYDHFYVKRGNKCQKFGHYKAECISPESVCSECSGNHDSLQCPEKSKVSFHPSCVNCKKSKDNSEQHTHSAADRSCPAYQSEQNKLKNSISYYTQKNL